MLHLKINEKILLFLIEMKLTLGMVDDLITKGTEEPYSYVLLLGQNIIGPYYRQDNADLRLTPRSFKNGFGLQRRGLC